MYIVHICGEGVERERENHTAVKDCYDMHRKSIHLAFLWAALFSQTRAPIA
jgi:hypothetical protein